jgi:hypothetical protein
VSDMSKPPFELPGQKKVDRMLDMVSMSRFQDAERKLDGLKTFPPASPGPRDVKYVSPSSRRS